MSNLEPNINKVSPLDAAFLVNRTERGRLRLTGRDRQAFLQGMVTGDVAALAPGQGCYAFVLDATGHVLADARVLCLVDSLLLDVEPGLAPFVAQTLDKYLIMEKCRISDESGETGQLFLGGHHAASVLARLGIENSEHWHEGENRTLPLAGGEFVVAATRLVPGPGFDLYGTASTLPALIARLGEAADAQYDAQALSPDALDAFRVEAGVPRFGIDIDPKVLAPETGAAAQRAISYKKGCYIGQEIVARIDARGHTNRTLAGFFLGEEGDALPAPGTLIEADAREVGRLTSVVHSPTLNRPIALGYVRGEFSAPGTMVAVGGHPAIVAALPFVSGDIAPGAPWQVPPPQGRE